MKQDNFKGRHTILIILCILAAISVAPVRAEEEYHVIATLEPSTPRGFGGFGGDIVLGEDLLLIGEWFANVGEIVDAGRVYSYDSDWTLSSTLQAPSPHNHEEFGFSIDALGDMVAVGAPFAYVEGLRWAGKTYVFDSYGSLLSTLQSPEPKAVGEFGEEVEVGKDVILVGETGGSVEGVHRAGRVHVFDREGVCLTTLTSPSMKHAGRFGKTVVANEEFILVGEIGSKSEAPFVIGSVHVFDYDWNHVTTLQAPEPKERTRFGGSIAISGDIVVIGEDWADVEGHEQAGRVYIFDTGWSLLATLQAPILEDNGEFGIDVAVGGDIIVVGERRGDVSSGNEGKAYVFDPEGNLLSTLTSPEPTIGAQFGWKVATDGEILVVSEVEATVDGVTKAGKVHIFQAGAAAFTSSGLTIDPSSVDAGGSVTISMEVANTGGKSGTHVVMLKINGEVEDEKTVTVNPDETKAVSFEVSASELGTFSVEIDGLSGSYAVTEPEEPSFLERIPGFQYESIVLGLAAGILVIWLLQRKREPHPPSFFLKPLRC